MSGYKKIISVLLVATLVFGMSSSNLAEDVDSGIFLIASNEIIDEEEIYETAKVKKFIEETREWLDINEYERELLRRFEELEKEEQLSKENNLNDENGETDSSEKKEFLESLANGVIDKIGKRERKNNIESESNPKINIQLNKSEYEFDTHRIGRIKIYNDKKTYYNDNCDLKIILNMESKDGKDPMLLKLAKDVKLFNFDKESKAYYLMSKGFVEGLIERENNNKYLDPKRIKDLDHISVGLIINGNDLESYELYEYDVVYYLVFYTGTY